MKTKNSNKNFSSGDVVKCVKSTTCGPYIEPSDKLFIVSKMHANTNYFYLKEFGDAEYFQRRDFEVVAVTKEQIFVHLEELEKAFMLEKDVLVAKLAFLEATGNSVYSVNEFKVWSILQELKAETDDVAKSKLIARIIEG